jgi:5,10-methylenetetrahydromethanopterin reductase
MAADQPSARGTPRFGLWLFPDQPAGALADVVVAAEAAGLDELWLGDEGPARDPLVTLAATAQRTKRIRLGVAITNPYLRHPAATASAFATLSELAPGRVVLGLGAGGQLALGPVGLEREEPLRRVADAVRVIRAVLQGVETPGYRPPTHALRAPDLPIYIGARGERLNRLASEVADGVFIGGIALPMVGTTVGWARSHRPVAVSIYPNVAFSADDAESIRPQMVYALLDAPPLTRATLGLALDPVEAAADALADGDEGPARHLIDDALLDRLIVRGTTLEVGRRLAAMAERHRATSVGVAYVGPDPAGTLDRITATAEAFRRALG